MSVHPDWEPEESTIEWRGKVIRNFCHVLQAIGTSKIMISYQFAGLKSLYGVYFYWRKLEFYKNDGTIPTLNTEHLMFLTLIETLDTER